MDPRAPGDFACACVFVATALPRLEGCGAPVRSSLAASQRARSIQQSFREPVMLDSDVPFRMLDLNLLRVLDALMTEGSVARAASRLSITPSAVSHALGRLRSLFGDPLFIRSSGGMRATPHASEIGGKVRAGLHCL